MLQQNNELKVILLWNYYEKNKIQKLAFMFNFFLFLQFRPLLKKKHFLKKLNYPKLYWFFSWYLQFTKPLVSNLKLLSPTHTFLTRFIKNKKLRYFFKKRIYIKKFKKLFKRQQKIKKLSFLRHYTKNQYLITRRVASFSLAQRLFLSQRLIVRNLWNFLYKIVKNSILIQRLLPTPRLTKIIKKKIFFLNAHKPLIWKMRKSRYAHWNLRTRGKLNEWRYNKLLGRELNFLHNVTVVQFLSFIIFITYYAILSWRQLILVLNYNLIIYNGISTSFVSLIKKGDILELPFGKIHRSQKKLKKHFYKILKKSKKISYKNFLSHKRKFWFIRKHTTVPKIFKRLPVGLKFLGKTIAYDPSINSFAIMYDLPKLSHHINFKVSVSSVISLQNWRYSFN